MMMHPRPTNKLAMQLATDKGKRKEKEGTQLGTQDPPPDVRQGHFRLMDLPAELRVCIYEYLLPHNMNFSFDLKMSPSYPSACDTSEWSVKMTRKRPGRVARVHDNSLRADGVFKRRRLVPLPKPEPAQTQLFLVSKAVSTEAKAILYGSNTYWFTINSKPHQPDSLRSPQIFGPFGYNNRLSLLRNMRSITIEAYINDSAHWDVKRLRTRLDYFVEELKQHAADADRSSLLTQLTVYLADRSHLHWRMRHVTGPHSRPGIDRYMFALEGLAELSGIEDVIVGGVPEWYAKCLQLCVQGKGGEVKETEWPLMKVSGLKRKDEWVPTRQWWQPMLNWKEFAERNGVEMPEDVDKYWADDS